MELNCEERTRNGVQFGQRFSPPSPRPSPISPESLHPNRHGDRSHDSPGEQGRVVEGCGNRGGLLPRKTEEEEEEGSFGKGIVGWGWVGVGGNVV